MARVGWERDGCRNLTPKYPVRRHAGGRGGRWEKNGKTPT